MGECVAHRAVHLRDAAQRVRVLHTSTVAMRVSDLASLQQAAQIRGGLHLSRMRTGLVNALVVGDVGTLERIAHHGTDHVGRIVQRFRSQQRERANSQHGLRAINQRYGFLRLEHQRLDLRALQRFGARDARTFFVEALAFADQSERQMSQRREIAAGANAALRGDERSHAAVQHLDVGAGDLGAAAGVAARVHVDAARHGGAHVLDRAGLADACGVVVNQVALELLHLIVGERAKPGQVVGALAFPYLGQDALDPGGLRIGEPAAADGVGDV